MSTTATLELEPETDESTEFTTSTTKSLSLFQIRNGTFTIRSTATGDHRTFHVHKSLDKNGEEVSFVSLLTGPDNETDFEAFAIINSRGELYTFRAKRTEQWMKLANMLRNLNEHLAAGRIELLHSGQCFVCGRTLTHPESIKTGIGPVCAKG